MIQQVPDYESFLALIQHWHGADSRRDQVGHCINVAKRLEQALDLEPQPVAARRDAVLAALGHDLYEDTVISVETVGKFGANVDRLIWELTEGKNGVAPYVDRVACGSEEARLIKLSDGVDNYGGLVDAGLIQDDPATWVNTVRRHMEPMFSRLANIPFQQYRVAGAWLTKELAEKRERFWAVVESLLRSLKKT